MNAPLRTVSVLATLLFAVPALAAPNDAVSKPVKTVVQAVRFSKDTLALKHFGGEHQGRFLLGEEWDKATDAQRKEFIELFHALFAKIAFPKVRENFKNLAAITYEQPTVEGDTARVASTVVIEHPLKKQELKLKYTLMKEKAAWKVVDVTVLGESMLTGIRDDQVKPLFTEGGWDALLGAMREKNKELASVKVQ